MEPTHYLSKSAPFPTTFHDTLNPTLPSVSWIRRVPMKTITECRNPFRFESQIPLSNEGSSFPQTFHSSAKSGPDDHFVVQLQSSGCQARSRRSRGLFLLNSRNSHSLCDFSLDSCDIRPVFSLFQKVHPSPPVAHSHIRLLVLTLGITHLFPRPACWIP
jgi:hypothetical protein